jgi:membrane protein
MINFISNLYIFFKELYENFKENKIFQKSTSLSYITFIGFFPAMAGFIHIYSLIFKDYELQIENFFKNFFFTSQEQLKDYVFDFLSQTRAIGNIAIIFSFLITIKLLFSIENEINTIWFVEKKRSFLQKLSSFTMILFWGPILYGFLNTIFYLFIKNKDIPYFLNFILPKLIFFILFAIVIKIVPATSVSFSSAFLGSFFTSIFLYFLKFGFFAYFKIFKTINVFTGSIGLALLFIITVNLFWVAILFGVLISYVKENFEALKLKMHFKNIPLNEFQVYFSLKVLYFLYEKFKEGKILPKKNEISLSLLIEGKRLDFIIEKLKDGGFLIEGKDGELGFSKDLSKVDLKEVIFLFLEDSLKVPEFFKKEFSTPIEVFLEKFKEDLKKSTPSMRFEEI